MSKKSSLSICFSFFLSFFCLREMFKLKFQIGLLSICFFCPVAVFSWLCLFYAGRDLKFRLMQHTSILDLAVLIFMNSDAS